MNKHKWKGHCRLCGRRLDNGGNWKLNRQLRIKRRPGNVKYA